MFFPNPGAILLFTVPRFVLKRFRTLCRRGGLHKFKMPVSLVGGGDALAVDYRCRGGRHDV